MSDRFPPGNNVREITQICLIYTFKISFHPWVIVGSRQLSNFSAIAWREQVNFNEMMMRAALFILRQIFVEFFISYSRAILEIHENWFTANNCEFTVFLFYPIYTYNIYHIQLFDRKTFVAIINIIFITQS